MSVITTFFTFVRITKPYDMDFRCRIVDMALSKKTGVSHLSKQLGLSRNTIYLWIKLTGENGTPAPGPRKGREPKIADLWRFRKIIDANPDAGQARIGELYGGVSQQSVSPAMKKIGEWQ